MLAKAIARSPECQDSRRCGIGPAPNAFLKFADLGFGKLRAEGRFVHESRAEAAVTSGPACPLAATLSAPPRIDPLPLGNWRMAICYSALLNPPSPSVSRQPCVPAACARGLSRCKVRTTFTSSLIKLWRVRPSGTGRWEAQRVGPSWFRVGAFVDHTGNIWDDVKVILTSVPGGSTRVVD